MGKQDTEICLLHLGYGLDTGGTRLLDCKFHVHIRDLETFPQLCIYKRHCGSHTCIPGIPTTYLDAASRAYGRISPCTAAGGSSVCSGSGLIGTSAGTTAHSAHIKVHIHNLFLDGTLICAATINRREQRRISSLTCISCLFDFQIGHLDCRTLSHGNLYRLFKCDGSRAGDRISRLQRNSQYCCQNTNQTIHKVFS